MERNPEKCPDKEAPITMCHNGRGKEVAQSRQSITELTALKQTKIINKIQVDK